MFLLNECSQCRVLDQETRLTPVWFKIVSLSVTGQSLVHLQANGMLLDLRRNVMLGPELDCTETWRLNQVASLSARKVENGVDRTGEEGDGRVGEATGEEGGQRGGSAAVDPGGVGRSWRR